MTADIYTYKHRATGIWIICDRKSGAELAHCLTKREADATARKFK
jgi:hypothetical protein